jgi:hypothetical protein
VSKAARDAGVGRSTVHAWRDADTAFRAAWDEAQEVYRDALEAEAHRRGVDGVQRPIYQRGQKVGEETIYSDTLLVQKLKAERPAKYRDNVAIGADVRVHGNPQDSEAQMLELARGVAWTLAQGGKLVKVQTPAHLLPAPVPVPAAEPAAEKVVNPTEEERQREANERHTEAQYAREVDAQIRQQQGSGLPSSYAGRRPITAPKRRE